MRVSIVLAALAAVASATSVSKRQIPDCATIGRFRQLDLQLYRQHLQRQ
ncbi:hypothetical protein AG1IA_10284 [Rhizoctonia solani AG-1 IA]|uniref:Uncharacterized protein n=1 Tax=Thanatephorus cucumeris (strain AG1-IA) TaxID=983506 RepID=L8WBX8_THACA|nr:hypothetical protein AG1IA_10284 [Rhizoctonia solani AG-1 IA]